MILSHGVKGLLGFEQVPAWGLVPIHLITKISAPLFILVFGISLSVIYLPHAGTPEWPVRRRKLWTRALLVFFWYKVLTIAELIHLHSPKEIVDVLLYRDFPVYVEILGFYAIALLWIPLLLPLWKRTPVLLRFLSPVLAGALAVALSRHFHFWHSDFLRTLLVEDDRHYVWGQLSRAPLVFLGLLIGEGIRSPPALRLGRHALTLGLSVAGLSLLLWLSVQAGPDFPAVLDSIARNQGKHPPEHFFTLFSTGGALLVLALMHGAGEWLARPLRPLVWIGKNALQAFVFHIFVIFVCFRFLLGFWHSVTYVQALAGSILLIASTALWVRLHRWFQENS